MQKVTAPYNFVPLSSSVCKASDLDAALVSDPSQDKFIDSHVSGTIPFTLTCDTPMLIGAGGESDKYFLNAPGEDGKPVIPGSSLRGMVRNVMEIASFSRMGFVENQRIAVRDLSSTARLDYGNRLNGVEAGWLQIVQEGGKSLLKLIPCKSEQILHTDLDDVSAEFSGRIKTLANLNDANNRGAKQVENAFLEKCQSKQVKFGIDGNKAILDDTGQMGTLVFTGLPGALRGVSTKLREFIFHTNSQAMAVPEQTWKAFKEVHEFQEKPSQTWKWREQDFNNGIAIPVFWMADESGDVQHIGLAGMFPIASDNSIHQIIANTHADHCNEDILDLPTRIFGKVSNVETNDEGRASSLGFKTRVSFGWSQITSDFQTEKHSNIVASRPKPSFVPSYIRQRDFADDTGTTLLSWSKQTSNGEQTVKAQYRSYMNWKNQKEQIRGWKRYPVRPPLDLKEIPKGEGGSTSTLYPIVNKNSDLKFAGKIRYHNLHPIELGALVWALTWGADEELRHSLGMGKPFGWGRVNILLNSDFKNALVAFESAMESWAMRQKITGGWKASVQVRQLLAMANPKIGAAHQNGVLKQMVLSLNTQVNEFAKAKANLAVLPEYFQKGHAEPVHVGIRTSAKGYEALSQHKSGQKIPAPPPRQATAMKIGGTVYYFGEPVEILAINGSQVTIRYVDDSEGANEVVSRRDLTL